MVAGVLGVLGFIVLLGYAVLGAGGGAAHASTETKTVPVKPSTITGAGCEEGSTGAHTGVYFVITKISDADAPSSVHVFWDNGTQGDAPLVSTPGQTAHYSVDFPAGVTGITNATAVVPADWDGQFNVSHYLCGSPSTSTPPTPPPSTSTPPSTPPSTPSTPPSTPSTPPSTPSTPSSTSSAPTSASSAPSSSSAAVVVVTSSPFVPGPGQTGDSGPIGGSILKNVLLGMAVALLTSAAALSVRPLRRRGNHT